MTGNPYLFGPLLSRWTRVRTTPTPPDGTTNLLLTADILAILIDWGKRLNSENKWECAVW
jgi:hypothetical protein